MAPRYAGPSTPEARDDAAPLRYILDWVAMTKRKPAPLLMVPDGELAGWTLLHTLAGVAGAVAGVAGAIGLDMPLLQLGDLLLVVWSCWLLRSAWLLARTLRDQRLARPVLSLLANPGPDPAGMLGPYLFPMSGRHRACSLARLSWRRRSRAGAPGRDEERRALQPIFSAVQRATARELFDAVLPEFRQPSTTSLEER
jgi:hypothetical protein